MAIDQGELKRRLALILEAESTSPVDWLAVEDMAMSLAEALPADESVVYPWEVFHFINDVRIRRGDPAYADRQRNQVRQFLSAQA